LRPGAPHPGALRSRNPLLKPPSSRPTSGRLHPRRPLRSSSKSWS